MKIPFTKPALTCYQQVELLVSRGMAVTDRQRAVKLLFQANYYRLAGYWRAFEADSLTHQFRSGTTFEDIESVYAFDATLRLLLFEAIKTIEISLRSAVAYHLATQCGPFPWETNPNVWADEFVDRNMKSVQAEITRTDEAFIKHMFSRYDIALPPIWATVEAISMGQLSRLYKGLKESRVKRSIAAEFGIDSTLLASWLHHLTVVRNICAHHGRFWNREFAITPKKPVRRPSSLAEAFSTSRSTYNSMIITIYLTEIINPGSDFRMRLVQSLSDHPELLSHMGFPHDWREFQIWKQTDAI